VFDLSIFSKNSAKIILRFSSQKIESEDTLRCRSRGLIRFNRRIRGGQEEKLLVHNSHNI
jgi:hypothetical protein